MDFDDNEDEFPLGDGRADTSTLVTCPYCSETVEISAPGITVGDTVLLGAARAISPGTPVRVGSVADQSKR